MQRIVQSVFVIPFHWITVIYLVNSVTQLLNNLGLVGNVRAIKSQLSMI